ncbi:MAG TPA: hypothetical protein VKB88_24105 [Bryobacteraceae bacterium]|nr:hypothetical protein [Bryobacteraceae bacterium]
MGLREDCRRRALLVLCILCLVVWAQSSALALQHSEHHSSEHCCLLCHAGPLPFLQTTVAISLAPVLPVAWFASAIEVADTHDVLIATSCSRAPPA